MARPVYWVPERSRQMVWFFTTVHYLSFCILILGFIWPYWATFTVVKTSFFTRPVHDSSPHTNVTSVTTQGLNATALGALNSTSGDGHHMPSTVVDGHSAIVESAYVAVEVVNSTSGMERVKVTLTWHWTIGLWFHCSEPCTCTPLLDVPQRLPMYNITRIMLAGTLVAMFVGLCCFVAELRILPQDQACMFGFWGTTATLCKMIGACSGVISLVAFHTQSLLFTMGPYWGFYIAYAAVASNLLELIIMCGYRWCYSFPPRRHRSRVHHARLSIDGE